MSREKKIVIIAGPNGAGKTTFAQEFLPNEAGCPFFVNADLIAAGLSPFQPDQAVLRAGRLMLDEIKTHVRKGNTFAFETTLSGRMYARMIPEWRALGYRVKLIFLSLPNGEMAIARVRERVAQGGHSVPEDIIKRRFSAGWEHFHMIYKVLVNVWKHYDNSQEEPVLIAQGENE
ncbi:MAG: Zeta toxin family protein [Candidatus Omnitrophota bacterium]|jgi:predicted ABC-type ATPase|nr:MAG: Zeta toxin family protein [Candidatus Omnitrophota bacterium]